MKDAIDSSLIGVDGSIGACLDPLIAALAALFVCIIVVLINVIRIILVFLVDISLRCTDFSLSLVTGLLKVFVSP